MQAFWAERLGCDPWELEVGVVNRKSASKEVRWKDLLPEEVPHYREAQAKEWAQWIRLGAVTILTPAEATAIPEDAVILDSRFVLSDKDKLLRSSMPQRMVRPPRAKARLVLRGDQESGTSEFRRDSPTGTELGAHFLCPTAANRRWGLKSLDATNAFF